MVSYLINRFIQSIFNIFFITVLVFLLARATGDPAEALVPDDLPEEAVIALRERLGLDKPLYHQYGLFIQDIARGGS
jgi:peptide/nickel transport system permease protein